MLVLHTGSYVLRSGRNVCYEPQCCGAMYTSILWFIQLTSHLSTVQAIPRRVQPFFIPRPYTSTYLTCNHRQGNQQNVSIAGRVSHELGPRAAVILPNLPEGFHSQVPLIEFPRSNTLSARRNSVGWDCRDGITVFRSGAASVSNLYVQARSSSLAGHGQIVGGSFLMITF